MSRDDRRKGEPATLTAGLVLVALGALAPSGASGQTADQDYWPARAVTLSDELPLEPVAVAIWDTGVDVSLFPGRLYVNPAETPNGEDDDLDGFVDDVHGIAFGANDRREVGLLHPVDELHLGLDLLQRHRQGAKDYTRELDTPEASAYLGLMPAEVPDAGRILWEDAQLLALYEHGTHVAGIAAEGNPFIRILTVRFLGDHHRVRKARTLEDARREAETTREIVDYFARHDVRVVNMSWVNAQPWIEADLEANGTVEAPQERAALAREIFTIGRDALRDAMRDAPEILFVAAAGNFAGPSDSSDFYPEGIELPNLITVGAVSDSAKALNITSSARQDTVHAFGMHVESLVPGGARDKKSGPSMATPAVTNLAAKLLSLEPMLTPEDLIALIQDGTDEIPGERPVRAINPRRSVGLLEGEVEPR